MVQVVMHEGGRWGSSWREEGRGGVVVDGDTGDNGGE